MPVLKIKRNKKGLGLLKEYASGKINEAYLNNIFIDKQNKCVVHNMSGIASSNELTTLIYYRKTSQTKSKLRYALIVFLVHPSLRNMGYGVIAMNEFIEYIRHNSKEVEIILHSVNESIPFYNKLGFVEIPATRFIKSYEDLEEYTGCFMRKINPVMCSVVL